MSSHRNDCGQRGRGARNGENRGREFICAVHAKKLPARDGGLQQHVQSNVRPLLSIAATYGMNTRLLCYRDEESCACAWGA